MFQPADVRVGLCETVGGKELEQTVVATTSTQVVSLVQAPVGVFLKPFAQNFMEGGVYVQIRLNRVGAPYTIELLRQGSRLSVNHESLRREINAPQNKLLYEFTAWSLSFEGGVDLPLELRMLPWGFVGHYMLIVVGPERYQRIISGEGNDSVTGQ